MWCSRLGVQPIVLQRPSCVELYRPSICRNIAGECSTMLVTHHRGNVLHMTTLMPVIPAHRICPLFPATGMITLSGMSAGFYIESEMTVLCV